MVGIPLFFIVVAYLAKLLIMVVTSISKSDKTNEPMTKLLCCRAMFSITMFVGLGVLGMVADGHNKVLGGIVLLNGVERM